MINPSSAVAELQSHWHALPDLDRARAVRAINQSGISLRKIAKHLNRSDSILRRLLKSLAAPPEDLSLARQGTISTNELVRRSKAAGIRRSSMHREAQAVQARASRPPGMQDDLRLAGS